MFLHKIPKQKFQSNEGFGPSHFTTTTTEGDEENHLLEELNRCAATPSPLLSQEVEEVKIFPYTRWSCVGLALVLR
jgi:hypothetical protein